MLGSLIALPAAALFWPSFPAAVDCVMAGVGQQRPESGVASGPLARLRPDQMCEAPRFENARTQGPFAFAQSAADKLQARPLSSHEQPQLIPLPVSPHRQASTSQPRGNATVPASYAQPSAPAAGSPLGPRQAVPAAGRPTPEQLPTAQGPRTVPAGMQPTSMRQNPPPPAIPAARADDGTQPASRPTFQEVQLELRRRGVTYSLLETLGPSGERYRFHCNVAVAGNARYTRHFEATSADPIAAMYCVLGQIEAWQSGRIP